MFGKKRTHFYYISFIYFKNNQVNFRDLYVGIEGQIDEGTIKEITEGLAEEHDVDHVAILDITPIAAPKGWKWYW